MMRIQSRMTAMYPWMLFCMILLGNWPVLHSPKLPRGGLTCIAEGKGLNINAFEGLDSDDNDSQSDFDGEMRKGSSDSEEMPLPSKGKGKGKGKASTTAPSAKCKALEHNSGDLTVEMGVQKQLKLVKELDVKEGQGLQQKSANKLYVNAFGVKH
jgi:hypothetical protein